MFCYFVCAMLDMMVLARRVGAETQLQRVTAGWWNQLMWETVDSTVLELCSKQWSLHQRCLLAWRLVFVTFGCVTLPRRFRLGIVFGGEVWRSGDSPSLTSDCWPVPACVDLLVYLFTEFCVLFTWLRSRTSVYSFVDFTGRFRFRVFSCNVW